MGIYVAGFNAHGQLSSRSTHKTVYAFQNGWTDPTLYFVCSFWSVTVLRKGEIFYLFGYVSDHEKSSSISGLSASRTKKIIGDTSGVRGAVSTEGRLYELEYTSSPGKGSLELKERPLPFKVKDLVISDNGTVAVYTIISASSPASTPSTHHSLLIFPSLTILFKPPPPTPTRTIPLPSSTSPLSQLLASSTTFTALTLTEVLTLGTALHPSPLGRLPTPQTPADSPHPISPLSGMPIRKIASRGFLSAALTVDNDCYIWGGRTGSQRRFNALPEEGEEVKLVELGDGGDVVDVVDVDVGEGHVVILTAKGEVWVCGEDSWGQLGFDKVGRKTGEEDEDEEEGKGGFVAEWMQVHGPWEDGTGVVKQVACGPWSTFVIVQEDDDEDTNKEREWRKQRDDLRECGYEEI